MLLNRSPSARGVSVHNSALARGRPERFRKAGLVFWFRADLGITIGTGISAAGDQSGAGNHVSQATGSAQPELVTAAYNGKPCARFVSASSQELSRVDTNLFGDSTYTLISALHSVVGANNAAIYGCTQVTGCAQWLNGVNRAALHPGVAAFASGATPNDVLELWTQRFTPGAPPTLRVNNVNVSLGGASTTMGDPGATAVLALGAYVPAGSLANFWDGDLCEAIAYTAELNASQVTRISHYMGARYGISA
jgi:hypothetical protein